jgi:hypothetical protein
MSNEPHHIEKFPKDRVWKTGELTVPEKNVKRYKIIQKAQYDEYKAIKDSSETVFRAFRRKYYSGELNEIPKELHVLKILTLKFVEDLEDRVERPKSGFSFFGKTRTKRSNLRNNVIDKCLKSPSSESSRFIENLYEVIKREETNLKAATSLATISKYSYDILYKFSMIRNHFDESKCIGYDGVRNFIMQVHTNGKHMVYKTGDYEYTYSQLLGLATSAYKMLFNEEATGEEKLNADAIRVIDYMYALQYVENLDFINILKRIVRESDNIALVSLAIRTLMKRFKLKRDNILILRPPGEDLISGTKGSHGGGGRTRRRGTSRRSKTLRGRRRH